MSPIKPARTENGVRPPFNTVFRSSHPSAKDCILPQSIELTRLERFGLQIRLRRKKLGLNPLAFIHKTGMELENLIAIEYGYAPIDQICLYLNQLAHGLNIPPNVLKKFLIEISTS